MKRLDEEKAVVSYRFQPSYQILLNLNELANSIETQGGTQQIRIRGGPGADPGYFVTGLNCGEAAMVIGGSGGEAPGKIF